MKVLYVVDSITEINAKINKITSRFGQNIAFIVYAPLATLFESYGYKSNAVYYNQLANVLHKYLSICNVQDIVIYYSSLTLSDDLLNNFMNKIGDKQKAVNIIPNYNAFEKFDNNIYNLYVKSIFKIPDSLCSPKLQFLPELFVKELIESHFANKLFQLSDNYVRNIYIEDKQLSKQLKVKQKFNINNLISIIIALCITIGLILTLKFIGINFAIVIIFIFLYILDIVISCILNYKQRFDYRFLK